eukprot:symbB.v1.2.019624.t1/scaffold1615.1/size109372/3
MIVCPSGHPLQQKTVTGSFFEFLDKKCRQCGRGLHLGHSRYSCKTCQFHLCGTCARLASTPRPSPGGYAGFPPSAPPAPGPSPSPPSTPSQPSCKWGAGVEGDSAGLKGGWKDLPFGELAMATAIPRVMIPAAAELSRNLIRGCRRSSLRAFCQLSSWPGISAAFRCREGQRDAPLVVDPFACLLSQAFQTDLLDETDEDAASLAMTQTAFVDRLLMDAVSRRLRQVLLWRSGTDTRAFRLQLPPQVRFIEVDDVHVHEVKSKILEQANARPRCALKRVGEEELSDVLDSKKPSFLVLDNLSLEDDAPHLESLSKTAAEGSRIVVQLRNLEGQSDRKLEEGSEGSRNFL